MKQRVSEIYVPLMTDNEIAKIIYNGEKLLNLKLKTNVTKRVLKFSGGLPSVCHHLCLYMCTNNNIYSTLEEQYIFNEEDFDKAVEKYVQSSSDSLKEIFDKAIKVDRVRKYNNPQEILKAFLSIGKDGLNHNEILNKIKKTIPDYPQGNLTTYLKQLQLPERGSILRYDANAGLYYFSSPFLKAYAHCVLTKRNKAKGLDIDFSVPLEDLIKTTIELLKIKMVNGE